MSPYPATLDATTNSTIVPARLGWVARMAMKRRFAMHKLRWLFWDRRSIDGYVDRILQPQPFGWIFLLGLNNSGTTLIANLLEHHPLIRCMPWEGQAYTKALPHPRQYAAERLWTTQIEQFRWTEVDSTVDVTRIKYDWTLQYPAPPGFLFEKSPPNVLRSRWLQKNFQPCRFIATFRSPYAVCEGIRRRTGFSLEEAATHWAVANAVLLEDMKRLDHVISYRYEDFCEDPEAVLTRIAGFLGVAEPFSMESLTGVESHSMDGRTRGITNMNARSIEQLSAEDIQVINRIAGPVMRELEYEQL